MSWDKLHKHYKNQDWIHNPSLFVEEVFEYFPKNGKILEIGAGFGQDSRFLYEQGYELYSTDLSSEALEENQKLSEKNILQGRYHLEVLDIAKKIPYQDESFDGIYAHLSLHYFSEKVTFSLVRELYRVLKPEGIIALLLNSKSDPEYGTGEKLEEDFYQIGTISKRYFSVVSTEKIISGFFDSLLLDNRGETYKDREKGIHNLIRFVGKKI